MKLILKLFFIMAVYKSSFCQVANDSCLSATEILPAFGKNELHCIGKDGFDVSVSTSNINSMPNLPYPAMKDCEGYSTSTSTYSNDVWFKLKTLGGIIYVYRESNSLDTVHLNIWHGNNCANLKPSGCYTFDMKNNFENYGLFCGDTVGGEYTYIQISGNEFNKVGRIGFCIKGEPCGIVVYFGTTSAINDHDHFPFTIYPNPLINQAFITIPFRMHDIRTSIYDLQGNLVKEFSIQNSTSYKLELDGLEAGLYNVIVCERNTGERVCKRIVITK